MRDRKKEVGKLLQYLKNKIDTDIVDVNNDFIFRMTTDLNIITLHCQYGSDIIFQIDFWGRYVVIKYLNNNSTMSIESYYTYEQFYYYWYDKICELVLIYFTYQRDIKKACLIDSVEAIKAEVRQKKLEQLLF
jgi:hypothetical protein